MQPKEKLRRIRTIKGWSQDDCDKFVGVKVGRTYSYERGRAQIPREGYMDKLAAEWGIPVDWVYNGNDDMPPVAGAAGQTVTTTPAPLYTVKFYGDLPTRADRKPPVSAASFMTSFAVPESAMAYRIGDEDLAPILRKGDMVLVMLDDWKRRGTLALIESAGRLDVMQIVREGGAECPSKLAECQPEPADDAKQVGYLAAVKRTLSGGLTITFECESGLAADMMAI